VFWLVEAEGERRMNRVRNQRQYPRHAARFSAKYKVEEGTFRDLVTDISAGGIFVATRQKIKQGQSIELQIPVPVINNRLPVFGKVVRSDVTGFAVMFAKEIYKEGYSIHTGSRPWDSA
jgi:hypothetical protein